MLKSTTARTRLARDERGFTLIELLVVILIIGILAAIALPSFLNQRGKAQDAEAKANAKTAQTAAETYGADKNGVYTGLTITVLKQLEPALNEANIVYGQSNAADSYDIYVRSKSSQGTDYIIQKNWAAPGIVRVCTTPGVNGCKVGSNVYGAGYGVW